MQFFEACQGLAALLNVRHQEIGHDSPDHNALDEGSRQPCIISLPSPGLDESDR